MNRKKAIRIALVTVASVGVCALAIYIYRGCRPVLLRGVSAAECPMELPAGASNVTYRHMGVFTPYINVKFQCSEVAFEDWVKRRIDSTFKRTEGEVQIGFHDIDNPGHSPVRSGNGIRYYWSEEDRSRAYLYDRVTGWAYHQINTR